MDGTGGISYPDDNHLDFGTFELNFGFLLQIAQPYNRNASYAIWVQNINIDTCQTHNPLAWLPFCNSDLLLLHEFLDFLFHLVLISGNISGMGVNYFTVFI